MNFTGGNTLPSIGRRINWQLITLFCGLAVALSAGALAGAFDRESSPARQAAVQPAPQPAAQASGTVPVARSGYGPAEMIYVIFDSTEEAAALQSAITSYAATYPELAPVASSPHHIVVIQTPEEAAELDAQLIIAGQELTAAGVGLRVLDMREPTTASSAAPIVTETGTLAVYVVGSVSEREQLEQRLTEAGIANATVMVIDPDSVEGALAYNTMFGEQMALGSFDIVDLRW